MNSEHELDENEDDGAVDLEAVELELQRLAEADDRIAELAVQAECDNLHPLPLVER